VSRGDLHYKPQRHLDDSFGLEELLRFNAEWIARAPVDRAGQRGRFRMLRELNKQLRVPLRQREEEMRRELERVQHELDANASAHHTLKLAQHGGLAVAVKDAIHRARTWRRDRRAGSNPTPRQPADRCRSAGCLPLHFVDLIPHASDVVLRARTERLVVRKPAGQVVLAL
jgi:hypothetical protein